jgi:cellulose synthase (UDP-forming)
MLMALFSSINAMIFFTIFAMGQTTWVLNTKAKWKWFRNAFTFTQKNFSYLKLSRIAFHLVLFSILVSSLVFIISSFNLDRDDILNQRPKTTIEKELGGFYTGIYDPHFDYLSDISLINGHEEKAAHQFSVISTYVAWGDGPLPVEKWETIINHGAIPMITWEPWSNLFDAYSEIDDLKNNRKVFQYILNGYFDAYIDDVAIALRDLHSPVFLRFAHEMENPMYPWSRTGNNTPEEFVEAWKYVHLRFEKVGAHNVSWVWSPWSTEGFDSYFPSGGYTPYVDWIGLTALDYGLASEDQTSKSLEQIYQPFSAKIAEKGFKLPVMLAEFGSISYGQDGRTWVSESIHSIKTKFPEIRSFVFFFSDLDKNWITQWRPDQESTHIDWTFDLKGMSNWLDKFDLHSERNYLNNPTSQIASKTAPHSLIGSPGNHQLIIDGQPFYIKGICYNPGHDWEEGFIPLSKKQLDKDFSSIKKMGANTVRRYEPSIYDRNILNSAKENDLKVMYGFWFDPKTDFQKDVKKLKAYEKRVLATVRKYQNDNSIIGWNIGNETWGILKKHFAQPYLTAVRRSYLEFLDDLAVKIKQIDPKRPVFSSEEHDNERLIGAIIQYRAFAPHVDVLGINSYYEENISQLDSIMEFAYPDKPYVVTEFGPKGYWNQELGDYINNSSLIELSSLSKAEWYERQWIEYIRNFKGKNLGGIAFSWIDRFEGTATWFGITDNKGRLKPAYYYLQNVWLEENHMNFSFPDINIVGHWDYLKPGESLWFSAAITNGYEGELQYSWVVYDQDWKKSSPILDKRLDGKFVEIKFPSGSSRLYLNATDAKGNVITASRPLLVR